MAEGKHLGAELGVGASADEHEVSDEADELVREAEKHADGSCPIGSDGLLARQPAHPKKGYARPAPEAPIELTPK